MQPQLSRRTALRATGSLGLGIATGSILVGNAAAGDHTLAHQLDTVRSTTRKYRDVDTAMADGYTRFGALPSVGIFFGDLDKIGDLGHTDPPSLLFYAPNQAGDTENEDLVLAGVEYHVYVDTDEEGNPIDPHPNIFDDEEASKRLRTTESEGWHHNPDFAGGVWGLHAWVHLGNPDGVFAGPHPTIRRRMTD